MIRARLIPDLGDELCRGFDQVRELLLTLAAWRRTSEGQRCWPAPLSVQEALHALDRVYDVVEPTQSHTSRPALVGGKLFSPDRSLEYRPLRPVDPGPADLDVLTRCAAVLGTAIATDPHGPLADAAEAAGIGEGVAVAPVELIATLARIHALLDLTETYDTRRLLEPIAVAWDRDLVLTVDQVPPYERTMARFDAIWSALDPPGRRRERTRERGVRS